MDHILKSDPKAQKKDDKPAATVDLHKPAPGSNSGKFHFMRIVWMHF